MNPPDGTPIPDTLGISRHMDHDPCYALRIAANAAVERLESICKAYPDDGWSALVLAALRGALK